MTVVNVCPFSVRRLSRIKDISKDAKIRLKFLEFGREHPVTVTCRRFGISRSTYYRWKKRFNPNNLGNLENRSRRPKNVRKPAWSVELVERIRELREEYPRWGKAKLTVLLKVEGFEVSESTVGRILSYLKRRGF
ncbi:MAG: helix-turn-helix domain-containing protein [Thermacetogeniaceae bacterium]